MQHEHHQVKIKFKYLIGNQTINKSTSSRVCLFVSILLFCFVYCLFAKCNEYFAKPNSLIIPKQLPYVHISNLYSLEDLIGSSSLLMHYFQSHGYFQALSPLISANTSPMMNVLNLYMYIDVISRFQKFSKSNSYLFKEFAA